METELATQIAGIARILRETIAPVVVDPYAREVLASATTTLELLASAATSIDAFLVWDIEATREVLRSASIEAPSESPLAHDPSGLQQCHRDTRALLEASIGAIRGDAEASAAAVALFRERARRFPFVRPETRRDPC